MAAIDPKVRKPLEWGFKNVLDEDGSGFIEQREANMVAKYLGRTQDGPDVWKQMLADMDTDGDGKISMEEYVTFMAAKYCNSVGLAQQLMDELSNKHNQHMHLRHAANAATFDDDLEEVALDGDGAAAADPAAGPRSPPT